MLERFVDRIQLSITLGDTSLGFETSIEGDHERVVGEGEDVSFGEDLIDLVSQDQVAFVQLFQRKSLLRLSMADLYVS